MIQYDNETILTAAQLGSTAQADIDKRSLPALGHPRVDRFITNATDVRVYYRYCPKVKGINVAAGQYTSFIPAGSAAVIESDRWAGEVQLSAPGATTGNVVIAIARDVE